MGRGSAPPMAGNGPAVRGSSVQGFPCRYYDWRVLDEHFERGFRQRAKQFTQSRGLPSGTDGIKRRRTGGLRIAFYSTKTRFDDRPSSHNASNGQTRDEGVARGKHIRFFDTSIARRPIHGNPYTCGIRFCLKGAMPARASSSARSFSGWPAWPLTQCQTTL